MNIEGRRRWMNVRDATIVSFALLFAGLEISLWGARASVLTFLSALLLSPVVLRADDARRDR
jgi:hypothetical protein